MRDAFGGSFMIRLFLVFLIIYMGFTAIAINYAKAFKVKNKVIDYIEDNEIADMHNMPAYEFDKMSEYFEREILGAMNYRVDKNQMDCTGENVQYCDNGIKIMQINTSGNNNKIGNYYRVETEIIWSIPFINKLLALGDNSQSGGISYGKWRISGETRPIVIDPK